MCSYSRDAPTVLMTTCFGKNHYLRADWSDWDAVQPVPVQRADGPQFLTIALEDGDHDQREAGPDDRSGHLPSRVRRKLHPTSGGSNGRGLPEPIQTVRHQG